MTPFPVIISDSALSQQNKDLSAGIVKPGSIMVDAVQCHQSANFFSSTVYLASYSSDSNKMLLNGSCYWMVESMKMICHSSCDSMQFEPIGFNTAAGDTIRLAIIQLSN